MPDPRVLEAVYSYFSHMPSNTFLQASAHNYAATWVCTVPSQVPVTITKRMCTNCRFRSRSHCNQAAGDPPSRNVCGLHVPLHCPEVKNVSLLRIDHTYLANLGFDAVHLKVAISCYMVPITFMLCICMCMYICMCVIFTCFVSVYLCIPL